MDQKSPMSIYWTPLVWASNIVNTAREEELITSDNIVQTFLVELSDIRRRLSSLIGYNTVCVPLVYTQVIISIHIPFWNTIPFASSGRYTCRVYLLSCVTSGY